MNGSLVLVLALVALASSVPARDGGVQERGLNLLNKKPPTKPTTTTTTTTTTTSAPETTTEAVTLPPFRGDYELVGNFGYYKLHMSYVLWNDAWKTCKNEGAHLIVLRSDDEFNAVYQWGRRVGIPAKVHYGAHHRYFSQEFVTVFDEPLESTGYNKWGMDISNTTLFNNKNYPIIIADISISWDNKGLFLAGNPTYGGRLDFSFICKQEL